MHSCNLSTKTAIRHTWVRERKSVRQRACINMPPYVYSKTQQEVNRYTHVSDVYIHTQYGAYSYGRTNTHVKYVRTYT